MRLSRFRGNSFLNPRTTKKHKPLIMNNIKNNNVVFHSWLEQWEKTKACYELLHANQKAEIAYLFFRHCMELKDCLKASSEFSPRRINALINCHWEFRLCRDLCQGKAHLKVAPEFLILKLTHIADMCMNRWNDFLRSSFEKPSKDAA